MGDGLQKLMENDSLLQSTEEQCCPVCQRPLSISPSVKAPGKGKKLGLLKLDETSVKQKGDGDLIISAMCGHLFHKFCLRHYCYTYRQGGVNPVEKVECPVCFQFISMTKVQTIDYKPHRKVTVGYERTYRHTLILNKELSDQKETAFNRLNTIENSLAETFKKLQTYRAHATKLVEKTQDTIAKNEEKAKAYKEIGESTKAIDVMHKENMQLVSMYLSIMKDKTPAELKNKRVPGPLIPYLAIIQGDEKLMRKFGEILKPVEIDGLRSNTEVLIQEILADVQPKAKQEEIMKSLQVTNLPKHFKLKRNKENPVVVKVHRSSTSIFSRTVLTEQSLQQIMRQVKAPIKVLKEATKKHNRLTETVHRSTSEIKVLFEPRKRQTESECTPSRLPYDDSDCEFGGKDLVPVRKCRSTEPILMTSYAKGPKALIVKMECLKQNKVIGDAKDLKDEAESKPNETEFSSSGDNNVKPLSFPSDGKDSLQTETKVSKIMPNLESMKQNGPPCTPYPNGSTSSHRCVASLPFASTENKCEEVGVQEDLNVKATCSVGFDTNVNASVLEFLFENVVEEEKPSPSLIDEVSKRTFGRCIRTSFDFDSKFSEGSKNNSQVSNGVMEYKIDHCGNVLPFLKNDQENANSAKIDLDIENEEKLNEFSSYSYNNQPNDSYPEKPTGWLTGILPGPYRNQLSHKTPTNQSQSMNSTGGPGNGNIPLYLTNWVSKLPSARIGAEYVTPTTSCRPIFPPPPSISNRQGPQRQDLINILPPLPATPLPEKPLSDIRNPTTNDYHNRSSFNCCTKNRPYGDEISETDASNLQPPEDFQDTVIDIPSSDSFNSKLTQFLRQKRPCKWPRNSNTNCGYPRTTLPPLPVEPIRYEKVYMVQSPTIIAPRLSQRVLTLAPTPPIKVIMHPKYSSSNLTRPSRSKFFGCMQMNHTPTLSPRFYSDTASQEQSEYSSPRFKPSAEGCMHRNCNYFGSKQRDEPNMYSGGAFVGNGRSQLYPGFLPAEKIPGYYQSNSSSYSPERHSFGPVFQSNNQHFNRQNDKDVKRYSEGINSPRFDPTPVNYQFQQTILQDEIPTRVVRRARRRQDLNV